MKEEKPEEVNKVQENTDSGNVHGVARSVQHLLGQNALKLQH